MSIFKKIDDFLVSKAVTRYKLGFSQLGEEKIVRKILAKMGIRDIYYLDIGTNDPIFNNNTYLFYCTGNRGVCVEANPVLANKIRAARPNDICLNVGACGATSHDKATFYVSASNVLSSFSSDHIESSTKGAKTIEVDLMPVNTIIEDHCERIPDFISLDVEGVEEEILHNFSFEKHAPAVFCIETLDLSGRKQTSIIEYMQSKNYAIVADTYVNTIFVDKKRWTAPLP